MAEVEGPQHPSGPETFPSNPPPPGAAKTALTCIALWFLALLPRLHAVLLGFVTPDEPSWVFRAFRFSQAMQAQRWADTFQIGHPGVITMWLGALGLWWQRWRSVPGTAEHLAWIDRVAWVTPDNSALFGHLAGFLPPARVAMAVLTALGVVVAYLLSRRLWGHRVALAGALLMALNPFLAALSGLLHVDAPATTFLLIGLLAWLVALQRETGFLGPHAARGKTRFLGALVYALLSGLCAGLAILAKSPSIFALVATGLAALLYFALVPPRSGPRLGRIAALGALWAVGLVAALYSFPAMWRDPWGVLGGIYGLAGRHLDVPHGVSFYRGSAGGDFGPGFYPTVLLFRLTPATLAGLVLAAWATVRAWRERALAASLLALWAFALGYTAFMTVAAKKFDRYLLPVLPALDLLAAAGWVYALGWFSARRAKSAPPAYSALLAGLIVAQTATALPAWPYLLDVYNPLAGGLDGALRTLAVGWGEGGERIAAYLNEQGNQAYILAAGSPVTLAPLVRGRVVPLNDASRPLADKVLITALDRQVAPEHVARTISGATLEQTVRVAGREILWLYDTRSPDEARHLATYGAPGDLVLCDAASPFCRNPGSPASEPWPGMVQVVSHATEDEIVELLNQASARHTRLWYLAYPEATGAASVALPADLASFLTAEILRRQLDSTATRLDHVALGQATATLYILPQEPRFEVGKDSFASIRFDGQLAVTGAMLYDPQPAADDRIRFHVHWTAESVPRGNYRAFIHLLDDGSPGAGEGHLRQAGRGQELLVDERGWPTSYWSPGGSIVGADYGLGLPAGLPPGDYWIMVGLADAESGLWLPVVDAEGRIVSTTAGLLPVQIGPAAMPPSPDAVHLARPSSASWPGLRLLGHSAPSHAQVGQRVVVEAGWTSSEAAAGHPGQGLQVALILVQPDGESALRQALPLSRYSTSRWRAGEVIRELYDLRLPAELPGGMYTLSLVLLDERGQALSLVDGAEVVSLSTLRVSVQDRLFELPRPPQQPLEIALGSTVTLLGYDLAPAERGVDRVSLTLYWRGEQAMETSYSVFVHLLDEAGRVQGQRDRLPVEGQAPTTGWIAGQIVVDAYEIPLNPDAPAGTYRIEVGMYNARDMTRLQMVDAEGRPLPGDRFLLPEEVHLEPAP